MAGIFSMGSLLLGLTGILLPLLSLIQRKEEGNVLPMAGMWVSLGCCSLAVVSQLFMTRYWVLTGNITGIMDTIDVSAKLALFLTVIVILLNGLVFWKKCKK